MSELLDELATCLKWASRVNPNSASNLRLRVLITKPEVLDYLERLDNAERFRVALTHRPTRSEHSLEGAAVNGLTPVGQEGPSE